MPKFYQGRKLVIVTYVGTLGSERRCLMLLKHGRFIGHEKYESSLQDAVLLFLTGNVQQLFCLDSYIVSCAAVVTEGKVLLKGIVVLI